MRSRKPRAVPNAGRRSAARRGSARRGPTSKPTSLSQSASRVAGIVRAMPGGLPPRVKALRTRPAAERLEAEHHEFALSREHARDLAQHFVRVRRELERVRQQHDVDAVGLQRERRRLRDAARRPATCRPATSAARRVRAEARNVLGLAPRPDLQAVQAKCALERRGDDRALLVEQQAAERAGEPGIEVGRVRDHAGSITAGPLRGPVTLAHARRAADPGVSRQLHLDDPRRRRPARVSPSWIRAMPRRSSPRSRAEDFTLAAILATHHHADHVGGVAALMAATGARPSGPRASACRPESCRFAAGERAQIPELGLEFAVAGRTRPHGRPHRLHRPWRRVLGGHAVQRGLRAPVRGHAGRDAGVAGPRWPHCPAKPAFSAATSTRKPIYGSRWPWSPGTRP